jgi:phenylalanyl-tRNA synthetase alpha chain
MSLIDEIRSIEKSAIEECESVTSSGDLKTLRNKYLGRKGQLAKTLPLLKNLDSDEKPQAGREANRVKEVIEKLFLDKEKSCANGQGEASKEHDLSMPPTAMPVGTLHPLTKVTDEICDIFYRLGFRLVSGPEMETEHYNFEALNIPADHPSRDSFDTFYLENGKLLRSQTSTVQIHVMEQNQTPIKVIAPGKVYRPDATDASHSFMFHQIEGLYVDESVSFAELKGVLFQFAREFFGKSVKLRFRPHYFPFTEPSAEVDISCVMCAGSGCRVCSQKGWLEILGAGMVHPSVLEAVKLLPEKVTGFAFGLGVERIAMLRWGVKDIRLFYENDLRFLRQLA